MRLSVVVVVATVGCNGAPTPERGGWVAPDNRWPSSSPPDRLRAEGWEPGQVVPDLRLLDQHGDEVSLWQLWDQVTLVSFSAIWCSPCRDLATDADVLAERYADRGFAHVTVLLEDGSGLPVSVEDAASWGASYGGPILADTDQVSAPAVAGQYPQVLLVDRALTVVTDIDLPSLEALSALIEAEL